MKLPTSKSVSNFMRGALCACAAFMTSSAWAAEQIVRNDTLNPPAVGSVLGDFAAGEMAAVVLTSPCDGSIVAVQILWDSQTGGGTATLEENVWIFDTGTPSGANLMPGPELLRLEGPLMTPGFLNEFRFVDEAGTIPIDVPVTTGQSVTVALQFGEATDIAGGSASVLTDANGCQSGRNFLYGNFGVGTQWWNFCSLGVSGDIIIRLVVDCPDPEGACCAPNGSCDDNIEAGNCNGAGETFHQGEMCANVSCPLPTGACCSGSGGCLDGLDQPTCEDAPLTGTYAGDGTTCAQQVCELGACCLPDGSCADVIEIKCDALGGIFEGPGTDCQGTSCPQPLGACCIGTACVPNQTELNCIGFPGTWQGAFSTCGPPNPCMLCNDGDADQDGDVDLADFADMLVCFGNAPVGVCECLDMNNDGDIDTGDLTAFTNALTGP